MTTGSNGLHGVGPESSSTLQLREANLTGQKVSSARASQKLKNERGKKTLIFPFCTNEKENEKPDGHKEENEGGGKEIKGPFITFPPPFPFSLAFY